MLPTPVASPGMKQSKASRLREAGKDPGEGRQADMRIKIDRKEQTITIKAGRRWAVYSGGWYDKPAEAIADFEAGGKQAGRKANR